MIGARLTAGVTEAACVAGVIDRFRPRGVSEPAAAFARRVVARAAPLTAGRAKALLFAAARLAAFGERAGLALDADVLLCEAVIERLVAVGCERDSPATRPTLRTNLRALGRALDSYPAPLPAPLPRERAKAPYSEVEVDGFLRLAGALGTRPRRMRATALVCLGAGAGVIASELRHLRGTDVAQRAGGVLVIVSGRRARSVPLLARYHEPLLAAAAFAGEGLLVGGREPGRRNISDELGHALSQDASLPRLEPGRLRSTWLVACAQRIGLAAFMQAAGIRCSQRLGDLAARLPPAPDDELVRLFGGGP
jgi:integrase